MWYLDTVTARDICSFRALNYALEQGVTTLIFGHNADNENQKSNGSGKSTLIEAIAFGITGAPLRKVRSEEIINDNADACCVQLRLGNRATGEMLCVEREIYRKGTSIVRCMLKFDGREEEVAQPSVDAYNKYILDKLGITRDELFSSFILSKHRYQDFLSSSDKEKKEIINRFSNGILVDRAIEKIESDVEPIRNELKDIDLEFAGVEGRIEMLNEQIRSEEENREQRERTKQEKIGAIEATIAEKRGLAREYAEQIAQCRRKAVMITEIDTLIQGLEDDPDMTLDDCICSIHSYLVPAIAPKLTDWTHIVETKKQQTFDSKAEIDKWTQIIAATGQKIAKAQAELIGLQQEYKAFSEDAETQKQAFSDEMRSLLERLETANGRIEELKKRKYTISGAVASLNARLAGTITCPACQHEFLVSDEAFDVEGAKADLARSQVSLEKVNESLLDNELEAEKVEQMMVHVRNETRNIKGYEDQWQDRLAKGERAVQAAEYEMEGARFNMKRIQDFVAARTKEIEDIRRNIFDEAYDCLDAAKRTVERNIDQCKEQTSAAKSSIETLGQTIKELETMSGSQLIASLRESLKSYRMKSSRIVEHRATVEQRIKLLDEQQQLFVQFKSYLANTKIEALNSMMNLILTDLGSDIRVSMSGYTILKSGAIREKISVSILRDGLDIGSFGKCSAGEAARVNLASLLAMQRLVNGNADFGKGLDLLVLDEILEAVDESGLATIFGSLNKLGVTALVVSHGLINEGYPHKLLIVKENSESHIHSK